jgi:enolase
MITLDGTADKSKLGANAILAVSLAAARAAARHIGLPLYRYIGGCSANLLPLPMMNILNGGAHADNNVDIQEFMIVPVGMESFSSALRAGAEIYASLKDILHSRGLSVGVGDEGGFAPSLTSEREALDLIIEAISAAGYRAGEDVSLALDIASSEWYDGERGLYRLKKSGEELDSAALCKKICSLVDAYPIISVEDGMAEDDFSGWAMLTERLRDKNVMLVGDDLFVTNRDRLIMGSNKRIANAILVKPNQIGTLSEVCDTAAAATYLGYTTVMSHRSGDTSDSFIADLSVALGSPFIKSGAPGRGERVAKYNRLLLIENEMFSPALAADFLK